MNIKSKYKLIFLIFIILIIVIILGYFLFSYMSLKDKKIPLESLVNESYSTSDRSITLFIKDNFSAVLYDGTSEFILNSGEYNEGILEFQNESKIYYFIVIDESTLLSKEHNQYLIRE